MTEATAPIPQSLNAGTEYVILKLHDAAGSEGRWDRIGPDTVAARSADQAIRDTVSKRTANDQSGTFIAVQVRSWHPVTVRTKTTTTLHLEEAKS